MSYQKTSFIYIYLILTTASGFPLKYDKANSALLQEPSFNNLSSYNEINTTLSSTNSTAVSDPRFSTYAIIGMGVGGALSVLGVLVLPAVLGFTSAGIVAGSTAAAMMSSSAVASGGGVAAGSLVAMLQSIGVLGVTASTGGLVATASVGTIGVSIGFGMGYVAENYFTPVTIVVYDAYNVAHNETVIFFTGNRTNSWKSFANWTDANIDFAVFIIKNGTLAGWEKGKEGTIDAWNTFSNWTIVNGEIVANLKNGTTGSWKKEKDGTIDAWNTFSNWASVNGEPIANQIKNGTIDRWKKVKDETIDAWNTFSNWTGINGEPIANQIKNGTIDSWEKVKGGTIETVKIISNWLSRL